ncbi:MAG: M20 metallopeptidase family protein [Planctomycetota bacterium]
MNYTDRWVSGQRSYADVAGTGLSVLLVTATMTERTLANLADLVDSQSDYIVELRHRLHRIPEQGFCEVKTAAVIADELRKLDLDIRTDVGETGIVADLVTGRPGKYVAVRADMDGLPLKEATGADYASENEGFSHSCGHDGHAAALVGAARILAQIRDQLVGKVRFVFQPAEEICQGAGAMIDCGVLEPGPPEAILGFHAWPGLPSDTVACRKGTMMASCDVLTIKVSGKGGHGARPELARNPLVGMARVVDALSTLDNHERIVSLCTARVGSQANIIAGSGRLSGTVRALNQQAGAESADSRHDNSRDYLQCRSCLRADGPAGAGQPRSDEPGGDSGRAIVRDFQTGWRRTARRRQGGGARSPEYGIGRFRQIP